MQISSFFGHYQVIIISKRAFSLQITKLWLWFFVTTLRKDGKYHSNPILRENGTMNPLLWFEPHDFTLCKKHGSRQLVITKFLIIYGLLFTIKKPKFLALL